MIRNSNKIPVAIIGFNGYVGLELSRLLLKHPNIQLAACFKRHVPSQDSFHKLDRDLSCYMEDEGAAEVPILDLINLKDELEDFRTVFLATPQETSRTLAPLILREGVQVIDLSAAFRANLEIPYGLMPWAQSWIEPRVGLISNPGCYATSVLMALIPLLGARGRRGVIDAQHIVIDAKSGTSGGGRQAGENFLFNEVDGDCLPYRVGKHQHIPEIVAWIRRFSEIEIHPHFSTSLIPVRRGIISAIYTQMNLDFVHLTDAKAVEILDESYSRVYSDYPLVRYGRLGQSNQKDQMLLSLKKVVGSCRTHISYTVVESRVYVFSCIDNLLKGAASQAVENWNVAHGCPVEAGLIASEEIL